MVEIIDSDARFGSSVKIYPENHPPSSMSNFSCISAYFGADSGMLGGDKNRKKGNIYGIDLLNFFLAVGCAENFFQTSL